MNRKVLKVMLTLVAVFLVGLYVVKGFLPEQFIMIIENERLVSIGSYIDERWWLQEICDVIVTFLTYWLYLCAITHRWKLNLRDIIYVLITIAVTHGIYYVDPTLCAGLSTIAMFVLPVLCKAQLKETTVVFSFHYMSQLLSTSIRSLPMLLTNVNYITILLLSFEGFLWLLLFYFYYNYRRNNNNGKNNATIIQGS